MTTTVYEFRDRTGRPVRPGALSRDRKNDRLLRVDTIHEEGDRIICTVIRPGRGRKPAHLPRTTKMTGARLIGPGFTRVVDEA